MCGENAFHSAASSWFSVPRPGSLAKRMNCGRMGDTLPLLVQPERRQILPPQVRALPPRAPGRQRRERLSLRVRLGQHEEGAVFLGRPRRMAGLALHLLEVRADRVLRHVVRDSGMAVPAGLRRTVFPAGATPSCGSRRSRFPAPGARRAASSGTARRSAGRTAPVAAVVLARRAPVVVPADEVASMAPQTGVIGGPAAPCGVGMAVGARPDVTPAARRVEEYLAAVAEGTSRERGFGARAWPWRRPALPSPRGGNAGTPPRPSGGRPGRAIRSPMPAQAGGYRPAASRRR